MRSVKRSWGGEIRMRLSTRTSSLTCATLVTSELTDPITVEKETATGRGV
jgi:hypothetical protein